MLNLADNKVRLWRYKITYKDEDGNEIEGYCTSEDEKDSEEQRLNKENIEYTTESVNQEGNEWIEGKTFNSRDEAVKMLEKGEAYYIQMQKRKNEQLRADTDYLAIMAGVEL